MNRRAFLQALGTARGTAEFIRSLSPTGAWNDGPSFHLRGCCMTFQFVGWDRNTGHRECSGERRGRSAASSVLEVGTFALERDLTDAGYRADKGIQWFSSVRMFSTRRPSKIGFLKKRSSSKRSPTIRLPKVMIENCICSELSRLKLRPISRSG